MDRTEQEMAKHDAVIAQSADRSLRSAEGLGPRRRAMTDVLPPGPPPHESTADVCSRIDVALGMRAVTEVLRAPGRPDRR